MSKTIPYGVFRRTGYPGEAGEHTFDLKPSSALGFNQQGLPECFEWFSTQIEAGTLVPGENDLLAGNEVDFSQCLNGHVFTAPSAGYWRFKIQAPALAVSADTSIVIRIQQPDGGVRTQVDGSLIYTDPGTLKYLHLEYVARLEKNQQLQFKASVGANPAEIIGFLSLLFGQRIG